MQPTHHLPKLLLAVLSCTLASALHALPTVFTSRAAWQAVTPTWTNIDFESYAAYSWLAPSGSLLDTGVTFDPGASYGADSYLFAWGPYSGYNIGSGNYALGGFNVPGSYTRWTDITFPTGFNSFGLDVATYGGSSVVNVTAVTNLGSYLNAVSTSYGSSGFIGLTFAAGETLSYLRVEKPSTSSDNFIMDNVSFGNTGQTSVPDAGGTAALCLLAFAGMAFCRGRLRPSTVRS